MSNFTDSEYSTLDQMPVEDLQYSIASQIAYDHYYNDFDEILTQDNLESMIEAHTLDPENSNDVGVTIIKPDGSAILAFRGTDPRNPYDLIADAQLATGVDRLLPYYTRLARAEELYKKVKEEYEDVTISGHSLGAFTGDYIARKHNEQAVVFNTGLSPLTASIMPAPNPDKKTIVYETDTMDLISHSINVPFYSKQVIIRNITQDEGLDKYLGSHSLDTFLPKERVVLEEEGREIEALKEKILSTKQIKLLEKEERKESKFEKSVLCDDQPELPFCKKKNQLSGVAAA